MKVKHAVWGFVGIGYLILMIRAIIIAQISTQAVADDFGASAAFFITGVLIFAAFVVAGIKISENWDKRLF